MTEKEAFGKTALNMGEMTTAKALAEAREALSRIADPRNIHFAGDAQVVAIEALAKLDACLDAGRRAFPGRAAEPAPSSTAVACSSPMEKFTIAVFKASEVPAGTKVGPVAVQSLALPAVGVAERTEMIHSVKSWSMFFSDILTGERTSDIRLNDRRYVVGDQMLLREFDPVAGTYTGREQVVRITYLQQNKSNPCAISRDALRDDYVVLSIKLETRAQTPTQPADQQEKTR